MDYFNEACMEIIAELKKSDAITKHDFNRIKTKVLDKYKSKVNVIPKNADIYFIASEEDRKKFKDILSLKPVRTISGVSPIALMSDPYPCPHSMKGIGPCSYCPGGPGSPFGDVPQSYTGKEPSTRRSIRNNYDPYLVVFNRLEHYIAMGKVPDKAEIIIQGGTFTFFPKAYQEYFVKYSLKAMNDFSKLFFNEGSTLDIEKFKIFFELPRVISKEDERTVKVQQKLLKIKQLDLNNKENLENANRMIFRTEISSDNNNFLSNDSGVNESNDNAGNNLVTLRLTKQKTSLNVIESQIDSNLLAIKRVQDKLKNENNVNLSLKQIQKDNETSVIRCVGLTIETKSDFGKLYHGNLMLELGCTRVELGIQSIYDEVLDATNRGNSVNDNIESIRILKDLGLKINAHYMPGLPGTTKDMDMHGLRQLFESGEYMPDMLKLYPCIVMEGDRKSVV